MLKARNALVMAAMLVSAGVASADSVTATLNNCSPSEIVNVYYQGQYAGQGYAGSINWTATSSTGSTAPTGSFSTYCDDLTQDVYIGSTYTYNIVPMINSPDPAPPTNPGFTTGMSATLAQDITNLYSLEYDGIGNSNDKAAAFQIAIWEMEYETNSGTPDVSSGNFYVTGETALAQTLANQYASSAETAGQLSFHNQILDMTSATAQDQLFIGPPSLQGAPPVPAPAAVLGGLPLLGILGIARKIRQRATR
ncbi:MAG TPA: hypothetical protein VGG19_20475 [Tepidisphaeraceae bacterium]|jgi:hypothetical protein